MNSTTYGLSQIDHNNLQQCYAPVIPDTSDSLADDINHLSSNTYLDNYNKGFLTDKNINFGNLEKDG